MKTLSASIFPFALVVALGPAVSATSPPQAPDSGQVFPSEVELVVVDAVVLDDDGNPVADLTAGHFTLEEDGRPQTITSFEAVRLAEVPEPAEAPGPAPMRPRVERRISTNERDPSQTVRSFVIVFDDAHLTRETATHARSAVAEFLREGVREGDLVTLIATAGGVWRSGRMLAGREELLAAVEGLDGQYFPRPLRERVTDYEAYRIHILRDPRVAARVERRLMSRGVLDIYEGEELLELEEKIDPINYVDEYVSGLAADAYQSAATRNRVTLEAMERGLYAQALARGRKSLILVSQGFIYDHELEELRGVARAARRANVAIYFVDARGLLAMPELFGAETQWTADTRSHFSEQIDVGHTIFQMADEAAGSETVASESGGFSIKNTNDLSSGLQRIADESRTYYLLGYIPTNTRRDGKFRDIEVKVSGKGLKVRARKGYYAPKEGEPPGGLRWDADADVQQALDAPHAIANLPLRMTSYVLDQAVPGKARVLVAVDVDIRALDFEERDGRSVGTVEYLLTVIPREGGGEPLRYDEKADLKLRPATRERLAVTGHRIVRDFELQAGPYRAKIVVRDKGSGQIGTVSHDFEVPSTFRWRVSTPVLTETIHKNPDPDSGLRTQPSARRVYQPGEMLYCEFQVYRAGEDPTTGRPRVAAGYSIQDGEGRTLFTADPTPIRPTASGMVSRLIGLSTKVLAPGDYALNLFVKDEVAGEIVEILEPFRVAPPDRTAQAASSGG
jgi:VWFA-related protein